MNKAQYFPMRSIFLMAVCLFVACEDREEVEELKQSRLPGCVFGGL